MLYRSIFLRLLTRENYFVDHENNVVAAMRVSYRIESSTKFTADSKVSRLLIEEYEMDEIERNLVTMSVFFDHVSCFESEKITVLLI